MKVLCIINGLPNLTKGKCYDFVKENEDSYKIIDDIGLVWWCSKFYFKTQLEVREEN